MSLNPLQSDITEIGHFVKWLSASKSEHTLRTYHTQVFSALRDFFFCAYDLPSPQFDDIAKLLAAAEICHRKDKELKVVKKNDTEKKNKIELSQTASGKNRIKDIIPEFKFERHNGQLKMRLRGNGRTLPRPEIRRDDEELLNVILQTLAKDKNRSIWPHLYKLDNISSVLQIAKDSLAPSTSNLRRAALMKFEQFLCINGELPRHARVICDIERSRDPLQPVPLISTKDMDKIFKYLSKEANVLDMAKEWKKIRNLLIFCLIDSTGFRASAVCDVKISDIDLSEKIILASHEKGGKKRILKLTDRFCKVLPQYLEARGAAMELKGINPSSINTLLVSKYFTILNPRHLDDIVHKSVMAAKVKPPPPGYGRWGPHTLRHRVATDLYLKTRNIETVRWFLGHESTETTRRYLRTALDEVNQSVVIQAHPRSEAI